jgi:hypothetical protein
MRMEWGAPTVAGGPVAGAIVGGALAPGYGPLPILSGGSRPRSIFRTRIEICEAFDRPSG